MTGATKNMTRSTGMVLALFVLSIAFVSITTPDEAQAKNVYKVHVDAGGDVSDAGDIDGVNGVSMTTEMGVEKIDAPRTSVEPGYIQGIRLVLRAMFALLAR